MWYSLRDSDTVTGTWKMTGHKSPQRNTQTCNEWLQLTSEWSLANMWYFNMIQQNCRPICQWDSFNQCMPPIHPLCPLEIQDILRVLLHAPLYCRVRWEACVTFLVLYPLLIAQLLKLMSFATYVIAVMSCMLCQFYQSTVPLNSRNTQAQLLL